MIFCAPTLFSQRLVLLQTTRPSTAEKVCGLRAGGFSFRSSQRRVRIKDAGETRSVSRDLVRSSGSEKLTFTKRSLVPNPPSSRHDPVGHSRRVSSPVVSVSTSLFRLRGSSLPSYTPPLPKPCPDLRCFVVRRSFVVSLLSPTPPSSLLLSRLRP